MKLFHPVHHPLHHPQKDYSDGLPPFDHARKCKLHSSRCRYQQRQQAQGGFCRF